MNEEEDPIRWTEGGAPEGALALLAAIDEPPALPPGVRASVRKAVVAEVRPILPWGRLLAAAAVALLTFGAGWIAARETPAPESVAAPIAPEPSRPAESAEEPAPSTEPTETLPAGSEATESEESPEPPRRRRATRRAGTSPDLLDPFADRRSAMSAAMREAPERPSMDSDRDRDVLDPFAGPTSPMREPDRGRVLDPFASAPEAPAGEEPDPPAEAATGRVVINTIPWTRVFIDGRDTGRNTPVTERVPAGRHRIGLRTADGTMHHVGIEVGAGETVRLMRRL